MLVNWSMFFFCSIAHPTIMLRRKVFFDDADEGILFKGYPEDSTFSCIEDYACWFEKIENSLCLEHIKNTRWHKWCFQFK